MKHFIKMLLEPLTVPLQLENRSLTISENTLSLVYLRMFFFLFHKSAKETDLQHLNNLCSNFDEKVSVLSQKAFELRVQVATTPSPSDFDGLPYLRVSWYLPHFVFIRMTLNDVKEITYMAQISFFSFLERPGKNRKGVATTSTSPGQTRVKREW